MILLHFIVNESAGNGKGRKKWREIQHQLNLPYEEHVTTSPLHAQELAASIAHLANNQQQMHAIIVIGGDGSINEVMNGVANEPYIVVGVIGAGSGNDFARGYHAFTTAQQVTQFANDPQWQLCDYGFMQTDQQQRIFVNNSGIGFDAYVAIRANQSKLKKRLNKVGLGKLSYVYFVMVGLFQFQPFELTVSYNGKQQHYRNVWFTTVSNQPYFGGGMKLSPPSKMNDGQLELTIVHNLSKWKFLSVFGTVFFAKHTGFKEVFQTSASEIELICEKALPMHVDGEQVLLANKKQTLTFSVMKQVWKLANLNNT